ncbi:MAG: alpha/beta fold hydrolase, partial [Pseudomonadota bacterium]
MTEATVASEHPLELAVRGAAERGNGLAAVQYRGLARDWRIRFEGDSGAVTLANAGGAFSVEAAGSEASAEVTLKASDADWAQFLAAQPTPGYQTLHAMVMRGLLTLSGDALLYQQYLLALEMMFDRLPKADGAAAAEAAPVLEPAVGRYLNLTVEGQRQRVYFEEAGTGTPLVCLHTAGADGRQYRGLLNDPAVTERFRVIVFDLPRHGKSSLAPGYLGDPYLLTTERYVNFVMSMIDALELDNPVVMGCSIGGRAVLHLALLHGKRFRAAIGLQSALHADPGGDDMTGQSASYLFRPDTNGPEIGAAVVAGITA